MMLDIILSGLTIILLFITVLVIVGFIAIFCIFIYQQTIEPLISMVRYTKSIKRLTRDEVIAENERIKQENEKYKLENPLGLEWLTYENGTPFISKYYQYVEWGYPVHWKLPEEMNIIDSISGFYRTYRHLTSREIMQLGQEVHFPRTYEEAKKKYFLSIQSEIEK